MEMHLVSRRRQTVHVEAAALTLELEEGESIWTESSYKYEPADIGRLVQQAGFSTVSQWIDAAHRFALTLVRWSGAARTPAVRNS